MAVNQVGHGLSVGNVVRLSGTSYIKAQANTEANAEAVGIVSAVAGNDDFTLCVGGYIDTLSGLTAGSVYYLDDDTAGLLTTTEPPDVGDVSKPLLIADTTTSGWIFNMRGFIVSSSTPTAGIDGWVDDTAATWTRTADQTFTVTGDRTAVFSKGTRLKWTQTTVKYGVVVASVHAAGTTTVTIATNTDYVLTAAAISANYYSYVANPQGYPSYFTYTPSYTGFSANPAAGSGRFSIVGRVCTVWHDYNSGTSNATGFTISAPVTNGVNADVWGAIRVRNNSVDQTTPGMFQLAVSSSTISVFTAWGGAAWTNSNEKAAGFHLSYLI